jgi:HrpA-like RNA helicase
MNVQDKSYQLQYKITTRLSDINAHMNKKYKRKIILCTNAAETGITMPHAKICVDTGFRKLVCYNPCQGMDI